MALWNKTDADASKPKYLSTADKAATVGVDVTEAKVASNIEKGINTPGWVKYTTYTDAQGNVRNKSEVLVAMSSISGDNDTLAPEITITGQPANRTVAQGETPTFTVAASRTGSGTLVYTWQKAEAETPTVFANIVGAPSSTSFTPGIVGLTENGDVYRVVVSLAGAESVTSNAATLTVTA